MSSRQDATHRRHATHNARNAQRTTLTERQGSRERQTKKKKKKGEKKKSDVHISIYAKRGVLWSILDHLADPVIGSLCTNTRSFVCWKCNRGGPWIAKQRSNGSRGTGKGRIGKRGTCREARVTFIFAILPSSVVACAGACVVGEDQCGETCWSHRETRIAFQFALVHEPELRPSVSRPSSTMLHHWTVWWHVRLKVQVL